MAQVGIKTAYVRVGDQVLELDHSFLGVNKADIKGIEPNVGEIDGSNEVQAYYFEGTGKSSIALTVNQLGMEWIAKVTGMQKAGSGNLFVLGDRPADVGVVVVSPEFGTNKEAVFAMDKAAATYSSASLSTNTSSKTNVPLTEFHQTSSVERPSVLVNMMTALLCCKNQAGAAQLRAAVIIQMTVHLQQLSQLLVTNYYY